jgi:ankyrin repeat protein
MQESSPLALYQAIKESKVIGDYDVLSVSKNGNTVLHLAVKQNLVDMISKLLSSCESIINNCNNKNLTPLHIAIKNGYTEIIMLLLPYTDLNYRDKENINYLMYAQNNNRLEIAKIILACNTTLASTLDYNGYSPLAIALIKYRGDYTLIKELLNVPQASITILSKIMPIILENSYLTCDQIIQTIGRDNYGILVKWAINNGRYKIFRHVINNCGMHLAGDALDIVIELYVNGGTDLHVRMFRRIIKKHRGNISNRKYNNVIKSLLRINDYKLVNILMDYKVIIDEKTVANYIMDNGTGYLRTAQYNDYIAYLIGQRKLEPNSTILRSFVKNGKFDIAENIIKANPNLITEINSSDIYDTIGSSNYQIIKFYFDNGFNKSKLYSNSIAQILNVGSKPTNEYFKVFIDYCPFSINQQYNNESPLHYAVKRYDADLVQYFIDKGADINAVNSRLETPLFYALKQASNEIKKVLINAETNINRVDRDKNTALILAVEYCCVETCELILKKERVNVLARNNEKLDAFDVAVKYGNTELCDLLVPFFPNNKEVFINSNTSLKNVISFLNYGFKINGSIDTFIPKLFENKELLKNGCLDSIGKENIYLMFGYSIPFDLENKTISHKECDICYTERECINCVWNHAQCAECCRMVGRGYCIFCNTEM